MAITGVPTRAVPFIPEVERSNLTDPTTFWIKPKTAHQANQTMRRYAAAGKEGRKGYRELSVSKLDAADVEEFIDIVEKVENYIFSDRFEPAVKGGELHKSITDQDLLKKVCQDLPSAILIEVFEAANDASSLSGAAKKDSDS